MSESMRKYIRGGLAAAFAMAALPLASASPQTADYDVGSIHITQPWTRATPKGASSAAGYLTVTNSARRLIASLAPEPTSPRNVRFTQ